MVNQLEHIEAFRVTFRSPFDANLLVSRHRKKGCIIARNGRNSQSLQLTNQVLGGFHSLLFAVFRQRRIAGPIRLRCPVHTMIIAAHIIVQTFVMSSNDDVTILSATRCSSDWRAVVPHEFMATKILCCLFRMPSAVVKIRSG